MAPKLNLMSMYIKNVAHALELIDYAGNKIEAQLVVLEDGSEMQMADYLESHSSASVKKVTLLYGNGKTKTVPYSVYQERIAGKIKQKQEVVNERVKIKEDGTTESLEIDEFLNYMGFRPSVEIAEERTHGLFTLEGDADIEKEKQRVLNCERCLVWAQVYSMTREEAERVGFDHRDAWKNLVVSLAPEIAKTYNIDAKNLVVNAAYHDKDHHPHLHLLFYSTDPREGVVKDMKYATRTLKSKFFNQIFKEDVSYLKEVRTDQRGQLEARLEELLRGIQMQSYRPPKEVCDKLLALSADLQEYQGKNVYAFHKPQIKAQVDEIVELMITKDRHLSRLFDAYLATQQGFVEQYQEDPGKIAARMEEFCEHFFHPRPAQRGKPGSGDRTVLHNEILRYAATLEESILTLPPPKPQKHKSSGTTAKKKKSVEEILNSEVYGALRDSVKAGDAPRPLENEVTTLYNEIKDDEFATAYSYVPLDAKAETRGLLHRMADASEPFQDALQAYLQKLKKNSKNPEITLDQLEKKFFDPSWRDNRHLHDTIVRFTKKLEEQRAVINYNSAVFFSLPDTFKDSGDKELLAKLTELNALVAKIPNEDLGFRELEEPLQEKITGMLTDILNSKEEIQIPDEVKQALLHPDDLTPVTFQNTITKFAKKLEQHRAVTEHNHEVYRALSDSFSEEGSPLLKALEQLHKLAKEVPPEKLSYYEQDIDLRAPANGILEQIFQTEKVHVSKDLQHEFLSPDELTPMGFQNTIFRFAKKLPVHRAVAQLRQEVFSSLLKSLDETSGDPALRGQLAELFDLLADIPKDQLAFRKLDELVREQVNEILAELMNGKEEIPEEVKQELLHPDELTPLGLQNTILRFAKKPAEHKAVTQYNSAVYFALSGSLDEDGDAKLLAGLEELHILLADVSIKDLNFRKLEDAAKGKVTELLESILNSKEEINIPAEVKQALLLPDELTPLGFQNTILRFAKKLEEHKTIATVRSDLYLLLSKNIGERTELDARLKALKESLRAVPLPEDLDYRKLSLKQQQAVTEILAKALRGSGLTEQMLDALLHPDELTPLGLQSMVIRFAEQYEQYRLASYLQRDLFMGLLKTTDNKSPLRQKLLALQNTLRKLETVSYSELPKEVQEQVNTLLRKLLKDYPAAKQHAKLLAELISPGKRTPTGLQNTVMRFACRYDEYVKRQIRQKAQYTAKLLLRSCAYSLAKLARENERYNDREDKQDSNLTGRRPMQTWRNYKEPEYEYD